MPAPVYLGDGYTVDVGAWYGMSAIEWTGDDGVTWDLTGTGGVALGPGIRGFGMPPVKRFTAASILAGSRHMGFRVDEREVFWPLLVRTGRGQQWVDTNRAFWRTLQPHRTGTWSVTQPGGERRRLICRLDSDGDPSYEWDPALYGWMAYKVTLVAEDEPHWLGDPVRGSWTVGDPRDFFGSGGPPFWISPAHTFGSATLTNPGDVEAWPVWTLHGPFASGSVGIGSSVLAIDFGLTSGQTLTIDSNPWGPTATMQDGTDRTGDVSDLGFAPIPAGQSIPLLVSLTGSGSVEVDITPRYYTAW